MAWEIKRYSDGTEVLKEIGPMGRLLFTIEERPGLGIDAMAIRSMFTASPVMLAALKTIDRKASAGAGLDEEALTALAAAIDAAQRN